MAKKVVTLDFVDIVMGADAEMIKAAYEARVKIDGHLAEREAAYRRIAELEEQVEDIVGEPGAFVFPAPPMPVAGYAKLTPASRAVDPGLLCEYLPTPLGPFGRESRIWRQR